MVSTVSTDSSLVWVHRYRLIKQTSMCYPGAVSVDHDSGLGKGSRVLVPTLPAPALNRGTEAVGLHHFRLFKYCFDPIVGGHGKRTFNKRKGLCAVLIWALQLVCRNVFTCLSTCREAVISSSEELFRGPFD